MREYLLRGKSKYEGVHIIYDTIEEFHRLMPIAVVWKWAIDDLINQGDIGDWIQAEDGYIVQLLNRYPIKKKDKPITTYAFRFPMGTFGASIRVDGSVKYPQFYAQFTTADKNSMSGKSRALRSNDINKVRFAMMVLAGMDPRKAYRAAFDNRRFLTMAQIDHKIMRLFMDEIVRDEIKQSVVAFKDDIKKKIPMSKVIEKIVSHWDGVKSGSSEEQKAIEFMMEIHDVVIVDGSTGKRKITNKIEDAEEAELIDSQNPAPRLGPSVED